MHRSKKGVVSVAGGRALDQRDAPLLQRRGLPEDGIRWLQICSAYRSRVQGIDHLMPEQRTSSA
jgi:hypothetical protein